MKELSFADFFDDLEKLAQLTKYKVRQRLICI